MGKRIALGACILVAGMGMARAAGIDPIAIRQVSMDLELGSFGLIRSVIAAKGDVRPLEKPAEAIARWQAMLPTLFPPGSEKGGNTKALPEIWSDHAGFDKSAAAASAAATKLAMAAKAGDADGVAAAATALGKQCGGCHRDYRAK